MSEEEEEEEVGDDSCKISRYLTAHLLSHETTK